MVLVFKNFLSQKEIAGLNFFVNAGIEQKYLDAGIDRGKPQYTKRLTTRLYGDRFVYPEIVQSVFSRITDRLRLHGLKKSVVGGGRDGVVVSCTYPGGDVYAHQDPKEGEGKLDVLRCNILTQAADLGGLLQVEGVPITLEAGDLHCYLASDVVHSVSTVRGNTPRILWMFGYQISKPDWELKLRQIAQEPEY